MTDNKRLFDQLGTLSTENRNGRTMNIDALGTAAILRRINAEDRLVAPAVAREIPRIAEAVDMIVSAFRKGGRLIYVGAGTSGRLGILDASECPPTYGVDPAMVQGIIAGGPDAVFRSKEGAEDREEDGAEAIRAKAVGKNDVVCGIAASMRTPFVIGAIKEARRRGAGTVYVTANPRKLLNTAQFTPLRKALDVAICLEIGPEVIMGSTRMKAGTAQKLVLNMITTASMVRIGKVYENMMIDLQLTNKKLVERAKKVIIIATGIGYAEAAEALQQADGNVKTALVMVLTGLSRAEAIKQLKKTGGFVRPAIRSGNARKSTTKKGSK